MTQVQNFQKGETIFVYLSEYRDIIQTKINYCDYSIHKRLIRICIWYDGDTHLIEDIYIKGIGRTFTECIKLNFKYFKTWERFEALKQKYGKLYPEYFI